MANGFFFRLNSLAGWLVALLCILLCFFGFVVLAKLAHILFFPIVSSDEQWGFIRNYLLVAGSSIGVPFLIWRTLSLARQTEIQEEAQYSKIFFEATSKLSSSKTRKNDTLIGSSEAEKQSIEDSLPERVGAIFSLSRLLELSEVYYWPTFETLSVFIKSNLEPPFEFRSECDSQTLKSFEEKGEHEEFAEYSRELVRKHGDLRSKLEYPREDVQAALQVITSVPSKTEKLLRERSRPNLRRVNIQKAVLKGGNFQQSNFQFVRAEGADFRMANFAHANMYWCRLEGALLRGAIFKGANIAGVNFSGVDLEGDTQSFSKTISEAYGDEWTVLPRGVARPVHWPIGLSSWQDTHKQFHVWRKKQGLPSYEMWETTH
jgi:hypothetical protein